MAQRRRRFAIVKSACQFVYCIVLYCPVYEVYEVYHNTRRHIVHT